MAGAGGVAGGYGRYGGVAGGYGRYGGWGWHNGYAGYHSGWVNGYWNGHYPGWGGWGGGWGGWGWGWGLGGLGLGMMSGLRYGGLVPLYSGRGYMPYYNPYYSVPASSLNSRSTIYAVPINTMMPPPDAAVADPAEATFDQLREAFKAGDYNRALRG